MEHRGEHREEHKGTAKKKYDINWGAIIVVVVVIALLSIFIIRPGYLGYSVYQKLQQSNYTLDEFGKNVQQLSNDLENTRVNLSGYADINRQLMDEVRQSNGKLNKCEVDKERTAAELEQSQADIVLEQQNSKKQLAEKEDKMKQQEKDAIARERQALDDLRVELEADNQVCQQNLTSAHNEYDSLQQHYDGFVKNIARSVCCKQKVDNAKINFYKVIDDRLVCLEDSGETLVC